LLSAGRISHGMDSLIYSHDSTTAIQQFRNSCARSLPTYVDSRQPSHVGKSQVMHHMYHVSISKRAESIVSYTYSQATTDRKSQPDSLIPQCTHTSGARAEKARPCERYTAAMPAGALLPRAQQSPAWSYQSRKQSHRIRKLPARFRWKGGSVRVWKLEGVVSFRRRLESKPENA
jgi:hypothetical protein